MTLRNSPNDSWDDASRYDDYMGRWSRPVAAQFVSWIDARPGSAWLDFGCGTGALTGAVLAQDGAARVIACDRSAAYVEAARRRLADDRARFQQAGLEDLPAEPGGFDLVVSGLVLNFLPDVAGGLRLLAQRAHVGGTVAAYVWDYADGMELLRAFWDAAEEIDPAAAPLHEGRRFPVCKGGELPTVFEEAGLRSVDADAISVAMSFPDFDACWRPFLGGQGPAPSYVAQRPPDERAALARVFRARLPEAADGSITLRARAWAARGLV